MIPQVTLSKMDLETVEKEIKSRQELLEVMVGWLYPSILRSELEQLYEKRDELAYPVEEVGHEREQNRTGSSERS